jgi:hypothetical protein
MKAFGTTRADLELNFAGNDIARRSLFKMSETTSLIGGESSCCGSVVFRAI